MSSVSERRARGPLRVHRDNPRYFDDGTGRAVYLTGSHTWANLQDRGAGNPPAPFDYERYLDFLERHNHNFFRLWAWSLTTFSYRAGRINHSAPLPWERTGPGEALDGGPKFDLDRWDTAWFERLRRRCIAAGARGIYVAVMLFEGHTLHESRAPWCWDGHPFNAANNVNGVDGNPGGAERGLQMLTLDLPEVTRRQEAFVRQVIDTVNDLDNVLYEISNESAAYSTAWQYHLIDVIHAYEREKPKQHPVGMTYQWARDPQTCGDNAALFHSPAEWISPGAEGGYRTDPPAADGSKVIITDTDHLGGISGDQAWVWKSFCRGLHPIFMDPYENPYGLKPEERTHPPLIVDGYWAGHVPEAPDVEPPWTPVRRNMGYTLEYARRMDLVAMTPHAELASSGYCLAAPGREYLVYLPCGGKVTVDLRGVAGGFQVEWLNPSFAERNPGNDVTGGTVLAFIPPFPSDAVLRLVRRRT